MKFLKKLFRSTKFPKQTANKVEYAFTCEGVDYYQFADFNNIPALRGLKTMVFYEELKMKCSIDYLKIHCEAVDNILSKDKINIFDIKKLNEQMKERLEIALDTELIYKLASIVFFDKDENVEDFDFAYNEKKVQAWKRTGAGAFFLLKPVQELLPVLKSTDVNFQMYSQVVEELNQQHWGNLFDKLPGKRTAILKDKFFFSAAATQQK